MKPQHLHAALARAGLPGGQLTPVSGGSLPAFRLDARDQAWFIKLLPDRDMAAAEADGLAALARSTAVVPAVHGHCPIPGGSLLVLEWLDMAPIRDVHEAAFACCLAALHDQRGGSFGWHRDNWIGAARQHNTSAGQWLAFYRDQRLAPQLQWACLAGLPGQEADEVRWVMQHLDAWLAEDPVPSLVHGDLWSGNRAVSNGQPALFDPAVYYGDPRGDLAMLHRFGSPGAAFWPAYEARRAVDRQQFNRRQPLYDLYHWLNHFTVFGESYLGAVQRCCATLRRELYG